MTSTQFSPIVSYDLTATIANGQTTSGVIDLEGNTLCGLYLPSNFTGSALSLQASTTVGGTFVNVQSAGSTYSLTGSASTYVPIESPAVVSGVRFVQIVAASAQTAAINITLAVRPL